MSVSIEAARPTSFDKVLGQDSTVRVLRRIVENAKAGGPVPSFLFHGPPGTGKTTSASILARELLGPDWSGNYKEMNASDERKIEDVRTKVETYSGHEASGDAPFRILLLDEVDAMTEPAQWALRRIMETSTTCRFILTCNKPSKVIDALHSRCVVLAFHPLPDADLRVVLKEAATTLGVPLDDKLLESIVARADGQARDAIQSMVGGDDDSRKWSNLRERTMGLFRDLPSPVDRPPRIEEFLRFLRAEGFDDLEDVLVAIDKVVRTDGLVPKERTAKAVEIVALTCVRMRELDEGKILLLRHGLYQLLEVP